MKIFTNLFGVSRSQAVKLESLRAGRTRYLVVVSRPRQQQYQRQNNDTPSHKITSHSRSESFSLNQTSFFRETSVLTTTTTTNLMSSGGSRFSDSDDNSNKFQCHPAATTSICDDAIDNESVSLSNEREESCLLGIDCNENTKTTVGMVLRVLADTAIRLDGDG